MSFPLWHHNALIYSLDVETFYDADGDGVGDLRGLIERLEYIAGMGFTCIWLLPFYPSPNRDNGYDVMDYYGVDPALGTLGDFAELVYKCEQLGLKLVIDLVVNHTSIRHRWFQEARKNRESVFRDYYVWSDEPLEYEQKHLMFKGEEESLWTFDEKAGQYYLHRFYKEQPDLNISNRKVQEEILRIIGFWLKLGIHGFRIDAAQMLVEPYGLKGKERSGLLNFLDEIRDFVTSVRPDALLLAEVNANVREMRDFMNGSERMHMLFNFYLNQHLFLSLATEDAKPLRDALVKIKDAHPSYGWLNFLRHHDELNLKLLNERQRQKVFDAFGPDKNMQIFGFGIRRRLAPMLASSADKLRLAYGILFGLPGSQMIRYGDEIGMGEDLTLEGRNSVRTPMQWHSGVNGGFSSASSGKLVKSVIDEGAFGYQNVNVLLAQQEPGSLLNWIERLLTTRRQCAAIGNGKVLVPEVKHSSVLIIIHDMEDHALVCVYNLSGRKVEMSTIKKWIPGDRTFQVFGEDGGLTQNLKPYAFNWYRVIKQENK